MESTLKKACKLFNSKQYGEVIHLLEPQIYRFREDPLFYKYLGTACFYTHDIGGAYTYIKRSNQLDPEDISVILCLALVNLIRKETNDAIQCWFTVLDKDPKNRFAKKGLEFVRKYAANHSFSYEELGRIGRFMPEQKYISPVYPIISAAVIIIALGLFLFMPLLEKTFSRKEPREGLAIPSFDSYQSVTDTGGSYRLILTEKEIRETYTKVISYFNDYRDNMARREINRLILSNASPEIKTQASLLGNYISQPSFVDFKDNFSIREVQQNPSIYEGCYVIWKGKISNLEIKTQEIVFDFLVGYHDQKVLEGIVSVVLPFAADLDTYFPIELLGKVLVKGNSFSLEGVSLHQLAP